MCLRVSEVANESLSVSVDANANAKRLRVAIIPTNAKHSPLSISHSPASFQEKHPDFGVYYQYVPCNGTVVQDADIGCDGHKNPMGGWKVAAFLAPKLKKIMSKHHPEWAKPDSALTHHPGVLNVGSMR